MKIKKDSGFEITFGAKFDTEHPYIGEDGREYVKAMPNTGITINFGASFDKETNTRKTKEYKDFIQKVLLRDNSQCVICGSKINPCVHHIVPYRNSKELRTEVTNGITLCECHHSSMILGGFHNVYGTYNNTKEQLQEYINKTRKELNLGHISIEEIVGKESL